MLGAACAAPGFNFEPVTKRQGDYGARSQFTLEHPATGGRCSGCGPRYFSWWSGSWDAPSRRRGVARGRRPRRRHERHAGTGGAAGIADRGNVDGLSPSIPGCRACFPKRRHGTQAGGHFAPIRVTADYDFARTTRTSVPRHRRIRVGITSGCSSDGSANAQATDG